MSAVVYSIVHEPRGLVYVGSTVDFDRRRSQWIEALEWIENGGGPRRGARGRAHVPWTFVRQARGTRACEWKFEVLESFPVGVSDVELWIAEMSAIERARARCGDLCLNAKSPVARANVFISWRMLRGEGAAWQREAERDCVYGYAWRNVQSGALRLSLFSGMEDL